MHTPSRCTTYLVFTHDLCKHILTRIMLNSYSQEYWTFWTNIVNIWIWVPARVQMFLKKRC